MLHFETIFAFLRFLNFSISQFLNFSIFSCVLTIINNCLFSVLSGDDAFALRPHMMKPYGSRNLNDDERIFNYRLSRARRVVENAFGILANRFQVLMSTMCHTPVTVRLITTTCCLLHNLMRTRYPRMQNALVDREDRHGNVVPGAWRRGRHMMDCRVVQGPNRDNREGKKLRNLLRHWVNSVGSVEWQNRMI